MLIVFLLKSRISILPLPLLSIFRFPYSSQFTTYFVYLITDHHVIGVKHSSSAINVILMKLIMFYSCLQWCYLNVVHPICMNVVVLDCSSFSGCA